MAATGFAVQTIEGLHGGKRVCKTDFSLPPFGFADIASCAVTK